MKETLQWLLTALVVSAIVMTGIFLIGKASYDTSQQEHKHRMECLDRNGEIKYVTNVGTVCVKD